ncbi:hypothetical protein MMC27_004959 [Xylographa pallens]|nr:hypothetical protein [Xylographa pallens]
MDPVSIIGTVVGVASLAIQAAQILHNYCSDASSFKQDVEQLLTEVNQLAEVLKNLELFLKRNSTTFLTSVTTNSTLYSANIRCELRLKHLVDSLEKQSQGSKARQAVRTLRWPFKVQETRRIVVELRGYAQTFSLALSIEGCQLLLKTSNEVSLSLKSTADLTSLTNQSMEDIEVILAAVSSLPQSTLAIVHGVQRLEAIAKVDESERALDWLAGTNASSRHQAIRRSRFDSTGDWFFQNGKPGAGKSVLTLLTESSNNIGIGYFYCEYSQAPELQNPDAILASFLRQLVLRVQPIPEELVSLYKHHSKVGTRPEAEELVAMLTILSARFIRVWLFVDALDELEPVSLDGLIGVLEALTNFTGIFITSRPQAMNSDILADNTISCKISAQALDLEIFIRSSLTKAAIASRRLRESVGWDKFVEDVVEKLINKADGMFILVSLQLDMLLRPRTLFEMRKTLENVPEKLPDFYAQTLNRIQARESDMAFKLLAWLVKCLRLLTVGELRVALAVEHSTERLNDDALVSQDDILEMCCGLVIIDDAGVISLAHATVHEYLIEHVEIVRNFDYMITKSCLKYLGFKDFALPVEPALWSPDDLNRRPTPGYRARLRTHPFLSYAATRWISHLSNAGEPSELIDLAVELLESENRAAMLQALSNDSSIFFTYKFSPLHAAAILGSVPIARKLVERTIEYVESSGEPSTLLECIIDGVHPSGNTALLYAVLHRHAAIAKILLETHVVNPSIQDNTLIRWTLEWGNEELLRLMIRSPKFDTALAQRQFPEFKEYFQSGGESGGPQAPPRKLEERDKRHFRAGERGAAVRRQVHLRDPLNDKAKDPEPEGRDREIGEHGDGRGEAGGDRGVCWEKAGGGAGQ